MPRSVVIYGPPGCGKTHNAEALRIAHGMKTVWDEGIEPPGSKPPESNALILSNESDGWYGFTCIPFSRAFKYAQKRGLISDDSETTTDRRSVDGHTTHATPAVDGNPGQ